MSDLDELISISISVNSTGIATQNFFIPMILSHNAGFSDRIRFYTSLQGVAGDFPVTTSPEYLAAQAIFGQSPHPSTIAIGRATVSVTMAYQVSVATANAGQLYGLNCSGQGVTPTLVTYVPGADISGFTCSGNVATSTAHGMTNGDGPYRVTNSGGALPSGLAVDTNYWINVLTANTFSFATSKANALAGTVITLSTAGTGTQTLRRATNDVIMAQLLQGVNAVSGANFTAVQSGSSGSQVITVSGNAANNWFSIAITDSTLLNNKQTQGGDPTSDLNAIINASGSTNFYQLITLYNSQTYVLAAAAWVESNAKTYIVSSQDSTDINTSSTGSSGLGDALNATGRTRTMWAYHPTASDFLDAAWSGRIVSLNPGSWNAAYKTLSGPSPVTISATQRTNLKARRGNYYTTRAGRAITLYGYVGSTVYGYLDIVVGIDFLTNQLQTQLYGVLAGANKIGYSDTDIAQLTGAVLGVLSLCTSAANPVLSPGTPGSTSDPVPTFSFPLVASIASSQRALRNLPNGALAARLLGAVNTVALSATLTF